MAVQSDLHKVKATATGEGDNVSLGSVGEILVKFSAFGAQHKANCLTTEGHYSHTLRYLLTAAMTSIIGHT